MEINSKSIVELNVETAIVKQLFFKEDQEMIDKYVKYELAKAVANKMIEEDLIQISSADGELVKYFKTKIKFIQE